MNNKVELMKLLDINMKRIVLHTFKAPITIHLENDQKREALRLLNQHYVQDDECNQYIEGEGFVAKYPEFEKENPEFVQSHRNMSMCYQVNLNVDLLSDGQLRIKNA
jgi:hypothetical protein